MIFIIFIIKLSVKFDTFVTKKHIFSQNLLHLYQYFISCLLLMLKDKSYKTLNYLTFDALFKFIIAFEKFDTNVTHKQ